MIDTLPRAHGGAVLAVTLRARPADFEVEEILGFEPAGAGEHVFVLVEKTGANTEWVARQLAAALGVDPSAVGFAGMKDRHAVTRQTFSVHLPGRADPDWSRIAIAGVRVRRSDRHDRKLRRGAHRGNRFRIRLGDVRGDREAARALIERIRTNGFPNYFGEQRFGSDAGNLDLARALFEGRRLPRHRRGIAISSARAALFNAVLGRRIEAGKWNALIEGDVLMLDGTHSIFGPMPIDDELRHRHRRMDVHPTGPLWGAGVPRSGGAVAEIENAAAALLVEFAHGLERAGLRQERRALRARCESLDFEEGQDNSCTLHFALASGCYATSLLRELCDWHPDPASR